MPDFEDGHTGGCHCGAIRYRTVRHHGNAWICNCHFCQHMTGGPFLVEHCFTRDEVEVTRGAPATYTHISSGSGKEVYLHFCDRCGSHLFLTLERWPETRNIFTTTLDDTGAVGYGPDTLRYLFLDAAQSATIIPVGFEAFEGHAEPADGSGPRRHVFDTAFMATPSDPGTGPHTGGCLCGDLRYVVDGPLDDVVICHCRSCQMALGSGENHEILVDPQRFRVTRGKARRYRHAGGSGQALDRRFCGRCGTALWLTGARFSEIGLFRGTLDRPNRVAVNATTAIQICLDEALPSAMVRAGIAAYPQHRRAPDGTIQAPRFYDRPWRIGDGPPA